MRNRRGFTLLETLITTNILVFGLAALALIFSYGARVNLNTQQRTTATLLLYEKLEELKFTSPLTAGEYVDYPTVAPNIYVRQWIISDTTPRNITVVVFSRTAELIRASTLVSDAL